MSNARLRVLQRLAALVLIVLGARSVLMMIDDAPLKPVIWIHDWGVLAQGIGLTIASYLVLIWSTGELLQGWELRLPRGTALRLWLRQNLARYTPRWTGLPLRLIRITEEEGIPQKFVVGAATHPSLIWLGTGALVGDLLYGIYRYGSSRYLPLVLLAAVVPVLALFTLAGNDTQRRIGLTVGRLDLMRPADTEALGIAIVANVVAWLGAGYGLTLLGQGMLVGFRADWMLVTGALATATVVGYAFLLLPTGFLVREMMIYALLKRDLGPGPALALAFSYRGIVTVIEMLASSFLLLRRPSRDA